MIIRASESNHWYAKDGTPRYTTLAKSGKQRPTTLRDARTEGLVPSVTTVLGCAAKPALIAWMQRQVLLAALTLPKKPLENDQEYLDRIMLDAKEQGRSAADAGTDIHAAVESFYSGKGITKHPEHVRAVENILNQTFGQMDWIAEKSFAHDHGFAGKVDLYATEVVVDIKSKEFTDSATVVGYDEHLMQLAAYRVGLGMPNARCANVYVSRNVPGLAVVVEWEQAELKRGWGMFCALLEYWSLKNKYRVEK